MLCVFVNTNELDQEKYFDNFAPDFQGRDKINRNSWFLSSPYHFQIEIAQVRENEKETKIKNNCLRVLQYRGNSLFYK